MYIIINNIYKKHYAAKVLVCNFGVDVQRVYLGKISWVVWYGLIVLV